MSDGPEPAVEESSINGKYCCRITIPGHDLAFGGEQDLYDSAFQARESAAVDVLKREMRRAVISPTGKSQSTSPFRRRTYSNTPPMKEGTNSIVLLAGDDEANEISMAYQNCFLPGFNGDSASRQPGRIEKKRNWRWRAFSTRAAKTLKSVKKTKWNFPSYRKESIYSRFEEFETEAKACRPKG
jgi:hypothetical protein